MYTVYGIAALVVYLRQRRQVSAIAANLVRRSTIFDDYPSSPRRNVHSDDEVVGYC